MGYTFKSMSSVDPSGNKSPDLVIVENAFLGEDGSAQMVDNSLELRLFEYGNDIQIGGTYTLNGGGIEVISEPAGLYYFAKVAPNDFKTSIIVAKWYAQIKGIRYKSYPDIKIVKTTTTAEALLLPTAIRDYVLRKLGFPTINIELDESHIAQSIDEVLKIYNKNIPKIKYGRIDMVSKQGEYDITEYGRGIVSIDFVRKEGTPLISDPLFGREYPRGQQLDFDQYTLGISFFKTLLKQTGQDPDWFYDKSNPTKLYLYARNYSNYYVTYKYLVDNRLEEINPSHHQVFKELVLAKCMLILGKIRSKFGDSVPTPSGDKSLDGASLIQQGTELEKEKTQEIFNLRIRIPPLRY